MSRTNLASTSTSYVSGPNCFFTNIWCHLVVACGWKLRNTIACPSLNILGLCSPTPFSATIFIRFPTQRCIKDKRILGDLFSNSSALFHLWSHEGCWDMLLEMWRFLIPYSMTCHVQGLFHCLHEILSQPIEGGWYGGTCLWTIPFTFIKASNEQKWREDNVWDHCYWYTMRCKYCSQFINHLRCGSRVDWMNLWPFSKCIN